MGHQVHIAIEDYELSEDQFEIVIKRDGYPMVNTHVDAGMLVMLTDDSDEPENLVGKTYTLTIH